SAISHSPVPTEIHTLSLHDALPISTGDSDEILTVKFRYKEPDGVKSKLLVKALTDSNQPIKTASEDFQFSAAVALFGMQLRDSRSEEHTSELQSRFDLVCRLLLEQK